MVVFPSAEWVGAWVSLANADPDIRSAGRGWDGTACLIVRDRPDGSAGPTYIRLTGRDGEWSGFEIGHAPSCPDGRLSLSASYDVWRKLIRQDLGPLRGILQGDIAVRGHLPDILKYRASIVLLCELAGRLDTEFLDG